MTRFIPDDNDDILNLDAIDVLETPGTERHIDYWVAHLRNGEVRRISGAGADSRIAAAMGIIVPARPGELLHTFFLSEGSFIHTKKLIVAWSITTGMPILITTDGAFTWFDVNPRRMNALLIDGLYHEIYKMHGMVGDEATIRQELERLQREEEAVRSRFIILDSKGGVMVNEPTIRCRV